MKLTSLLKDHKIIGVKWVYKKKMNPQGKIEKYKARLIAKCYKKQTNID
jgi:Reverse transcriptase (RNA-dependent DNA polymerase)